MTTRCILLFVLLSAVSTIGPASLRAQHVSARARVDSTVYLVGDRIHVKVDLRHSRGLTLQPMMGDTLEGFHVLGRSPIEPLTDTTSSMEFVLARYDSGDAAIPPVPFLFFVPGDTASHVAQTNQLVVTITTVPQDTTAGLRDIKPPLAIPMSWEEILLYAGIALLVGVLAYLAYRWWKKRQLTVSGEAYVPPARPAHVLAMEALADLKAKKLWQQGLLKEYYSELTEIFRRYIELRYGVPSLEATSDETIQGLRGAHVGDGLIGSAETILRRADLVKFAKHHPTVTDHEDSFRGVTAFVEKTRLLPMTPVPAEERKAKTNVES